MCDKIETEYMEISDENVYIIPAAASSMEFVEIKQKCNQHLLNRITVENCVHHFMCADKINVPELRKSSFDEIVKNFSVVSPNDLSELNTKLAIEIFNCDEIWASEDNIFHAVQMWIEINEVKCPELVKNLLICVRLEYISAEFLANSVEHFFKKHNYQELVMDEYRNRTLNRRPHRKERSGFLHACYLYKEEGEDSLNIKRYDLKDNKWDNYMSLPIDLHATENIRHYTILHYENKIYVFCNVELVFMRIDLTTLEQTNMPTMYRIFFGHIAVDGKIYGFGGIMCEEQALTSCECFDTKLLKWEDIEPMPTPRETAAVALLNGDIYVAGGCNNKGVVNVVERYSPKTNRWTKIASMNVKRCRFQLTEINGYLYAFGGDHPIDRYDLKNDIWTTIDSSTNDISSLFPIYNDIYVISTAGQFTKCSLTDNCSIVECARFDENNRYSSIILYK